jgi:hypothetical protein
VGYKMGKKIFRFYSLFFILLFLTLLSSCEKNRDPIINLDTKWTYSINGIHGHFIPFELSDFSKIKKSLPDRKGNIYLKTNFSIPLELKNKTLKYFAKYKPIFVNFQGIEGIKFKTNEIQDAVLVYKK